MVAHRTSPTNIGLLLLSTVAAYDLGYESLVSTAVRLHNTFKTLAEMERHQGHFLNWYDTRSLDPLPPRYISMVDNGNLAGCLVALRQSLDEMAAQPVLRWSRWQGLLDTLGNSGGCDRASWKPRHWRRWRRLRTSLQDVGSEILAVREEPDQWIPALLRLIEYQMPDLLKQLRMLVSTDGRHIQPDALHGLRIYLDRVHHQTNDMQREIDTLAPWLQLFATDSVYVLSAQITKRPTLNEQWQTLTEFLLRLRWRLQRRRWPAQRREPVARTLATELRKLATARRMDDVIATWTGDLLDRSQGCRNCRPARVLAQLEPCEHRCADLHR